MKRLTLRTLLFALAPMLNKVAGTRPAFRARLKQHDIVAQIRLKDGSMGRHFLINGGKVKSVAGVHPRPHVDMVFKDVDTALTMMRPNPKHGRGGACRQKLQGHGDGP